MKPSRFNHFISANGGEVFLAYNSYSGAMAEIEKEHYDRVRELLADPGLAATPQDQEFLQCLKEGGFLVPDGVDQVGTLRQVARNARAGGAVLTLTVVPTLACNFACPYCFESRSAGLMDEKVQDELLRFTDRQLNRAEALRVEWFGGEPTLCFPLLERLQTRLLDLAERRRVEMMPGRIVSNGYLLDGAMARRLRELHIEKAQITIDGPEPIHDSRRTLRNGKGTFRRIIDNLAETVDILEINIRINTDKSNVETAGEVILLLAERGILPKVRVHFGQVTPINACVDIGGNCYTDVGFSRALVKLYRRLLESGIPPFEYPEPLDGMGFCSSISDSTFVISPSGLIFRCVEELSTDPDKAIGSLFAPTPTEAQRANLDSYRNFDPFKLSECLECAVLPLCAGGCPLRAKELTKSGRGLCAKWKFNLADVVELNYQAEAGRTTA